MGFLLKIPLEMPLYCAISCISSPQNAEEEIGDSILFQGSASKYRTQILAC